jgi:hypothetical protein
MLNAQKGHQKRATDVKAESQLSISIGEKHFIRLTNTVIHLTPCQVRGDWSAKERRADDDFYEGNHSRKELRERSVLMCREHESIQKSKSSNNVPHEQGTVSSYLRLFSVASSC